MEGTSSCCEGRTKETKENRERDDRGSKERGEEERSEEREKRDLFLIFSSCGRVRGKVGWKN